MRTRLERLSRCIALCLVLALVGSGQVWASGPAADPDGKMAEFAARLADLPPEELDDRTASGDRTMALMAAWARVQRTLPQEELYPRVRVDQAVLGRFIGFVEGRLGRAPPDWWTKAVLEARTYGRDSVHFPFGLPIEPIEGETEDDVSQSPAPPYHEAIGNVLAPDDVTVDAVDAGWKVRRDGHTCVVTKRLIEDRWGQAITMRSSDSLCFVALFNSALPSGFPLVAIDDKHAVQWESKVLANGGIGTTGVHWQWADMQVHDDEVIVYGINTQGAYIEGFDGETGEALFRFGTGFFRK